MPPQPAYYLSIVGGADTVVTDGPGNSTAVITGTLRGEVPGVTSYRSAEDIEDTILSGGSEYTVTFRTTTEPVAIELNYGTVQTPTQVVRYLDLALPVSITAMLRLTPGEIPNLRYDADTDGVFETVVTPTVAVSGAGPLDVQPPVVNISATLQGPAVVVTIAATDDNSGVAKLSFSLDGTHYQAYTSTLVLSTTQTPVVYAFADDNLANRSSLVTYALARLSCCDYNGNGKVDVGDLQTIGKQWGTADPAFDFDGDGGVDLGDLNHGAAKWRAGGVAPSVGASVPATPTLRLVAPPGSQPLSGTIDVQIVVSRGTDLGGFEFELNYDRSLLRVVSVSVDSLLGSGADCDGTGARCAIVLGPVDQASSSRIGAFSYGTGGGVGGDNVLGVVRLQSQGVWGRASLRLVNLLLADTAGHLTTPNAEGVVLTIGPGHSVFLPLVAKGYGG